MASQHTVNFVQDNIRGAANRIKAMKVTFEDLAARYGSQGHFDELNADQNAVIDDSTVNNQITAGEAMAIVGKGDELLAVMNQPNWMNLVNEAATIQINLSPA